MKRISFIQPLFTFNETVEASGADSLWLRNIIARDKAGLLGTKHRTGRLQFALRDIAAIAVLHHLNARLRIAPSAAREIVAAMSELIATSDDPASETVHVAFDDAGRPLVWTVDPDGVAISWSDAADANPAAVYAARQRPSISIPMTTLLAPIGAAAQLASSWPESDDR